MALGESRARLEIRGQPGLVINNRSASSSPRDIVIFKDLANDTTGKITNVATADTTNYGTSSDKRLKTNFSDFDGIAMVLNMKPVEYERISNLGV